MKHIIYEPLVGRVNLFDHISHFQTSNGSQLSCCQLPPRFFVLHQNLLHPVQFCCHHTKMMNLRLQQQVTYSFYQPVCHLPSLCIGLEVVQLCSCVGGLAIELVYRRGIQGLAEHLVSVFAERHYQRIGGHDGLCVVRLLRGCFVGHAYGIVDVMKPLVDVEPQGLMLLQHGGHV